MRIVRFASEDGIKVGVDLGGRLSVVDCTSVADLLRRPYSEFRGLIESARGNEYVPSEVTILPPIDGHTEVWAAGVTYLRSKTARMEESLLARVYELVDQADRPEVFFKSVPWKVVTDAEPISVRRDSLVNAPEAELALMVNAFGEIVGYAVFNDVSSRSIEGENPLYLPQAKIYAGSCAIGAAISPAWSIPDVLNLNISVTVLRNGEVAWEANSSTGRIRRDYRTLVDWLFEEEHFPDGVVLATGTDAVPPLDFTLRPGDSVIITIESIGTLTNPVVSGKTSYGWLANSHNHSPTQRTTRIDNVKPKY